MIHNLKPGSKVWFVDGGFLREGKLVYICGGGAVIQTGRSPVVQQVTACFANEADARRTRVERLTRQIASLQEAHAQELHRLAELSAPVEEAEEVTVCSGPCCGQCCCQS
jgi:hypothetical protein